MFTSILLYLIDSYSLHAASAIAANAVVRYVLGAALPLTATYLYNNLGLGWAGTRELSNLDTQQKRFFGNGI